MMTPRLQQRFDQLLRFAADPTLPLLAYENIAAAKELVDTLKAVGGITDAERAEYRAEILIVRLAVSAAELKRAEEATKIQDNPFDGTKVADKVSVRGLSVDVADFLRKAE